MGDTMGLALAYPKLKKLYLQKFDWENKQLDNVGIEFYKFKTKNIEKFKSLKSE